MAGWGHLDLLGAHYDCSMKLDDTLQCKHAACQQASVSCTCFRSMHDLRPPAAMHQIIHRCSSHASSYNLLPSLCTMPSPYLSSSFWPALSHKNHHLQATVEATEHARIQAEVQAVALQHMQLVCSLFW